jgi:hypothetical protein
VTHRRDPLRTRTGIGILALLLLLAATAPAETPKPARAKNATGCSLTEGASPSRQGCRLGGRVGCYECLYSDPFGIIQCFETPDGSTMACRPYVPE